jgi:hypothetical protein
MSQLYRDWRPWLERAPGTTIPVGSMWLGTLAGTQDPLATVGILRTEREILMKTQALRDLACKKLQDRCLRTEQAEKLSSGRC